MVPEGYDWLDEVFQCQAARTGGVIRRQVIEVQRKVGERAFVQEVRRRSIWLVRTSQHFAIICNDQPIELIL